MSNISRNLEKKWRWQDEYLIKSYHVDPDAVLAVPQLCQFFQETAYNHADHLEFGYRHLEQQQQFWVLARLLVKIRSYPRWRDKIIVRTWPAGFDGILAIRHFQVESPSGEKLAGASSSWLILDSDKRRPVRPEKLRESSHLFPAELALDANPTKIRSFISDYPHAPFPVRFSDLDLYDHVNNARYVQWVLDSYPRDTHRLQRLTEFEINFAAEAKFGDTISIHTRETENAPGHFLHCVKRIADNRDVCLVRTVWEEK